MSERITDRIITNLLDGPYVPVSLTVPEWEFVLSELSRHNNNDSVTKKIRRVVRAELTGSFPNTLGGPI